MNAPASRQRRKVEERREQLLDLALELFIHRTYEELSIDDIAQAAGISKGLLYHYFPSKRAFYVAAVGKAADHLLEATEVTPADPAGVPTIAELRRGMGTYLAYVEERAESYKFLLRGGMGGDTEVRAILEEARTRFAERIERGLGAPIHPRVRIAIRGWVGFVEAASLEWIEHKDMERNALAAFLVETFLAVLRTSGAIA
jgi:AcrR family transcriptional regulator